MSLSNITPKLWLGASILAMAATSGLAVGQEADASRATAPKAVALEEIVVTAQRREEKLQEVPLSITAIGADDLAARGIRDVLDLSGSAPTVIARPSAGAGGISVISIRGSATSQPAIWVDPPVGVYLDGVYLGKAQGSVLDIVDVQRVEVLRGPQGTLFGRNTEGGAINYVSRQPSGEFRGKAEISGGDYNHWIGKMTMDLPKWGILSASLGARKEKMDGWAENLTGPQDLGARDQDAYRAALKFDFTDDFRLTYSYDYSKADNTPIVTSVMSLRGWAGTFPSIFGATLGTAIQTAMTPYVTTSRPDKVSTPAGQDLWEKMKNRSHTLVMDWQATDTENFKYIFADRKADYEDRQSINGTPLDTITVLPGTPFAFPYSMTALYHRITDYEQRSHELQWLGDHGRLRYVVGLYYFEDEGETIDPQRFGMFGQGSAFTVNLAANTEAKAAYTQVDWDFADRWTLTAGIRYTKETRDGFTHQWQTNGYGGPFVTDNPAACGAVRVACLPLTTYSKDFTGTTPMAALAFRFNEDLNFYARVARGFKSGGFSSELINPLVTTPYQPEFSTAYELGAKSTLWDGRANVNLTVFYTDLTDQQGTVLIPGTTSSYLQNAGEGERKGVELETRFRLTEGWTFGLNYGYLDAKYKKYLDNSFAPGRPIVDTGSNRLPGYAPKNTIGANLDGRLFASQFGDLRMILDYTYSDKYYLYAVNKSLAAPNAGGAYVAALDAVPSNSQLNARLLLSDIPAGPGSLDLSLFVRNVTDEDKMNNGIDFSMFRSANWQEPRTWLLSAGYKW
ncbi:MAG: TonB-dependent receptor [Steroidobacteraceae bacterium]|nr:Vitamin B12 transporter BtuB [Steroidobacteraceae bacterium]